MFPKFADVIAALDDLKERGLVEEYAVFGAVAQAFWDEAIPTFDLDVLVLFAVSSGGLISLGPLYQWAEEKDFQTQDEHIVIGDIPVQIVPAPTALHEEAVRNAATLDFNGSPIRVVRPEYLIATWLQPPANSLGRKERAARLRESAQIDHDLLDVLIRRFGLSW
jgi:hypothetical protein